MKSQRRALPPAVAHLILVRRIHAMPTNDSPEAMGKAGTALIIVRGWGAFIALCHLGGLAGAFVPVFLPATRTSGWSLGTTSVSVAHHIAAVVAGVTLLVGLRSARFALLLAVALSVSYCLTLFSESDIDAVV